MPTPSEITRIMDRSDRPGRTRKWRRFPARSGQRPARERPPMTAATATFKAVSGDVMVEIHCKNRTGHEVQFHTKVANEVHWVHVEANGSGVALFTVRPHRPVIVRDGGANGPILYEGEAPSIGEESFA